MHRLRNNGNGSALLNSADGNLSSDRLWTYSWDADGARKRVDGARRSGVPGAKRRVRKAGALWATEEQNQLTSMTMKTGLPIGMTRKRLEFTYDYLRRRVQKVVKNNWNGSSGTTISHLKYVYDGNNQIAELNGSNNTVLSTYVWGLDLSGTNWGAGGVGGLLMITDGSKVYFPGYDGNGNVSALLDSADGSLDAKYEYSAFGEPLRVGGTAIAHDNPFRYSTKYTDTDEARQRVDGDAEGVARRAEEAGAPWALMRQSGLVYYGFVENDPVNGWDYLGLDDELICGPSESEVGLCDDGDRHHEPERRGFFKRLGGFFGGIGRGIGRAIDDAGRAVSSIGQGLVEGVGNIGQGIGNTAEVPPAAGPTTNPVIVPTESSNGVVGVKDTYIVEENREVYLTERKVFWKGPKHLTVEYATQVGEHDGEATTLSAGPRDGLLLSEENRKDDEAANTDVLGIVVPPERQTPGKYFQRLGEAVDTMVSEPRIAKVRYPEACCGEVSL